MRPRAGRGGRSGSRIRWGAAGWRGEAGGGRPPRFPQDTAVLGGGRRPGGGKPNHSAAGRWSVGGGGGENFQRDELRGLSRGRGGGVGGAEPGRWALALRR